MSASNDNSGEDDGLGFGGGTLVGVRGSADLSLTLLLPLEAGSDLGFLDAAGAASMGVIGVIGALGGVALGVLALLAALW